MYDNINARGGGGVGNLLRMLSVYAALFPGKGQLHDTKYLSPPIKECQFVPHRHDKSFSSSTAVLP